MQNESDKQNLKTNKLDPAARHNARRYLIQAMYEWQLASTPLEDIEYTFLKTRIDRKCDVDYFKTLLYDIPAQQAVLEQAMEPYLGRLLKEVDPIELAVLYLGTYELLLRPEIPYRVVLNEALELVKKFGSVEGYKFINSVLDRVAKKYRVHEV
ncbi:MAG TPA: transcription antitermination factor NusB [Gammaproteobacteria bacterium]|jgi:N utilization substance protein B|nr:transcription antitermination factor NusB [Gammaproteobacteria bacterium]